MDPQATRGRPVRAGAVLAVAHHPVCTSFRTDVVLLGGLPVCAGCLATWPTFLVVLPLAIQLRLEGAPGLALLAAGFALGLPQMLAYLRRRRPGRLERALAKVLGGAGLGASLVGALTAGWPLGGALLAIGGGLAVLMALQAARLRQVLATCDGCPYRRDWDACPGMVGAGPVLPGAPRSLLDRAPR